MEVDDVLESMSTNIRAEDLKMSTGLCEEPEINSANGRIEEMEESATEAFGKHFLADGNEYQEKEPNEEMGADGSEEGEEEEIAEKDSDEQLPKLRPKRERKIRSKRKRKEKLSPEIYQSDIQMTENFRYMRKRRQDLTLSAKVKVLEMFDREPKVPQGKIAAYFHVSQSQVSRIIKNKEAIMTQWSRFATPERKRCRVGKAGELEQKLLDWYKEAKKEDLPMSGPILMEKAKSIGVDMGIDFKPSTGWLGRWKDRNGVSLKVFREKDGTTSVTKVANHWRRYMYVKVTKDVPHQNIWVVDETVLAYNAVPDSMSQVIDGGRDKMTVILACNLSGTERRPAAIVGPVESLENLSLPVSYYYHEKSRISSECFSAWLQEWDRELQLRKKKIVLILSQAKYHPSNTHFFNISITHFPTDTTKVLHPLQLGIISSFKALYRHQQLKHLLSKSRANESITHANTSSNTISWPTPESQGMLALDAVYMIYKAWKHVSPETIAKGAVKAGLSKDVDALKVNDCVAAPPGINQQDFMSFVMNDNDITVEDSGVDNRAETQARPSSMPYKYTNASQSHVNSTKKTKSSMDSSLQPYLEGLPKVPEAVFACQVLKRYLQQQGGRLYDEFSKLESAIQMDMIHQSYPEMVNEGPMDPLHDSSSIHSLQAHVEAESLKLEHLKKLNNALEEKALQKELKKSTLAFSTSTPLDSNCTGVPTQELRNKVVQLLPADIEQSDNLPVHEVPRQDIQPTMQRPSVIQQDVMRPEFQQTTPVDKPGMPMFEMRPVDMSYSMFRPVLPAGVRHCQSETRNPTVSSLPANPRVTQIADPQVPVSSHHPHHTKELHVSSNIHQPNSRIEQPVAPYYGIHYASDQCACGNAECCS